MANKPRIFTWSADHSGGPLAERFQEEGHGGGLVLIHPAFRNGKFESPKTPEEIKQNREKVDYLNKNFTGVVKKTWADGAMRTITKKDFCIFDQIFGAQYGEALYKRGVPVLGGSKVGFVLETERQKTLALLKKLGFDIPPQQTFGPGSSKRGIEFLKNNKDDTLWVFKSDNPKCLTCVAHENNDELIQKLEAESALVDSDGFILQEKKDGIELAVETWYSNGRAILSNVDIEAKKKYNEMSEVQTGCAFSLTWTIPINHPLRERVNGPLDDFAKKYIGTGLLDLGVIYSPHDEKMWVLECCGSRFAYNAIYGLMAKCQMPLGEFFIKYLKGEFKADIGEKIFGNEFAGSLRVFNDGNSPDQRIMIPEELRHNFWIWDCNRQKGNLVTTGTEYGEALGIITAIGENPESAMAKVRQNYYKLYMPTKFARSDYDEDDELGLPLARYHAMRTTKLIE